VGGTRQPLDPPTGCGGSGRFGRRMGDDQAWRRHLTGCEAQAARRHQIEFIEDADDDGETRGLEAFFDCIQGVAGTRRLDDDQARRIEAQMSEARQRQRTKFSGNRFRPAPQHPGLAHCVLCCQRIDPAHGETHGEAYACHPVGRRGTLGHGRRALDFVDRIRFQASRKQGIAGGAAKPPIRRLARCPRIGGGRGRRVTESMTLQALDARAQAGNDGGLPGGLAWPNRETFGHPRRGIVQTIGRGS